jgi:hypothetical protein
MEMLFCRVFLLPMTTPPSSLSRRDLLKTGLIFSSGLLAAGWQSRLQAAGPRTDFGKKGTTNRTRRASSGTSRRCPEKSGKCATTQAQAPKEARPTRF